MPELALFHFIRPGWLLALLPLALLAWHLARGGGNDDNPWRRAVDAALLPLLSVGRSGSARRASIGLVAAGWAIAALALAGPTWQRKPQPVFQTSAARVVVLDLSNSMLANDVAPSRLERARFKVEDVLALGGEGQTGLVAYAGDAFAVAPLTRDANTVRSLLAVLAPDLMPVPGSRADRGLLEAQKLMRQAGVSRGEVLLIADGVDPAHADDAKRAAAQLLANGYRVSVLGVGAPAAGGASAGGVPALDAAALQAIANAGGGRYLSLADSSDALRALLDTGAQARVDAARSDAGATASVWVDQGPWLVLLLLPIAALAFRRNLLFETGAALGAAPPRKTPARAASAGRASALVVGALSLAAGLAPPTPARASVWDDAWQRPDQQAAAAMQAGDYARAASLATDAELRGSAEYKRGNYAAALSDFARASGPRADYNRGNALAQLGRYADAIAAYDKSLAAEPGNADAKANKAAVEALLKEQQAKKSKDQPRDGEPQGSAQHDDQQQGGGQQDGQPQRAPQQSGQPQGAQQNDSQQPSGQQQGGQQHGSQQQGGQQRGGEQHAGQTQANDGQRNGTQSQTRPLAQQPSQQPQASAAAGAASNAAPGAESASRERTAGAPQQQPAQSFTDAAKRIAEANDTRSDAGDASAVPPTGAPAAAAQRGPAAGSRPIAANAVSGEAQPIPSEEQLAAEQWLRRIPDDPGGLLRRKFLYQYRQRSGAGGG